MKQPKVIISKVLDPAVLEKETEIVTHKFIINPELPEGTEGNSFEIEYPRDHIISYKYPRVYAIKRPTWEANPTRNIEDLRFLS